MAPELGEYDDTAGFAADPYAAPDDGGGLEGARPPAELDASWNPEATLEDGFQLESGGSFGAGADAAAPEWAQPVRRRLGRARRPSPSLRGRGGVRGLADAGRPRRSTRRRRERISSPRRRASSPPADHALDAEPAAAPELDYSQPDFSSEAPASSDLFALDPAPEPEPEPLALDAAPEPEPEPLALDAGPRAGARALRARRRSPSRSPSPSRSTPPPSGPTLALEPFGARRRVPSRDAPGDAPRRRRSEPASSPEPFRADGARGGDPDDRRRRHPRGDCRGRSGRAATAARLRPARRARGRRRARPRDRRRGRAGGARGSAGPLPRLPPEPPADGAGAARPTPTAGLPGRTASSSTRSRGR